MFGRSSVATFPSSCSTFGIAFPNYIPTRKGITRVTTIAPPATPLPEIPYRGIESFRYIDQRVFCSREEQTLDLLSNILINRGVLLYGDSGCGKSSLINAGLIPAA